MLSTVSKAKDISATAADSKEGKNVTCSWDDNQ